MNSYELSTGAYLTEISRNSPSLNSTSRTAPCGPSGPRDFPLERIVSPPAFPARSTAGSRISTLWVLPGSIRRAICVVPSLPRIEIQDGSEASSSILVAPTTAGPVAFGAGFPTTSAAFSFTAGFAGIDGAEVAGAGFSFATLAGAGGSVSGDGDTGVGGAATGTLETGAAADVA